MKRSLGEGEAARACGLPGVPAREALQHAAAARRDGSVTVSGEPFPAARGRLLKQQDSHCSTIGTGPAPVNPRIAVAQITAGVQLRRERRLNNPMWKKIR
jgi:hypothetical protein